MNLKMLFIVNDEEKKINKLIKQFNLPFNTLVRGMGTASQGILDFLGLSRTEKNVLISIIPDVLEKKIIDYLRNDVKIQEIGRGVAFNVPLTSSSKYVMEEFTNRKGEKMEDKCDYQLLMTIANEGYAEKIMNVAKKNGANGGTIIKGRSLGSKNSFKFFNVTVEPEKDIILIVCKKEEKDKIMKAILDKNGMNTDIKGMCFSLPVTSTVGIDE